MAPSVHSPVRSQPLPRAANVQSPARAQRLSKYADNAFLDTNNNSGAKIRTTRRRRVFVQTETGNVLGLELGRGDNIHTIKKRMQNLLHMPMEQADLVCGDTVLGNNMSELRNNTPLLLSRALQRSLSTPCISPAVDLQLQRTEADCSVEVVGGLSCCNEMKVIINEIVDAVECGINPVSVSGGLGGAYYFRNRRGDNIAILKPTDEEPLAPNNPKGFIGNKLGLPGLKRGIRVGETGVREVAAYLLDHDHFANVPPTVLVKVHHRIFSSTSNQMLTGELCPIVSKIASCQKYVYHDYDASDRGSSCFPVSAVHRIGILDIRIFNTDRHSGNILIKELETPNEKGGWGYCISHPNNMLDLIPIDHGLCLPETMEDPYFEWLHWPQASLPFSDEELEYIKNLDVDKDVDLLRMKLPMLREASLRILIISTILLKEASVKGFCLAEVGGMMTRDGMGGSSELEALCVQAKEHMEKELSGLMPDGYVRLETSVEEDESADRLEIENNECGKIIAGDTRRKTLSNKFSESFLQKEDCKDKSQASASQSIVSDTIKADSKKVKRPLNSTKDSTKEVSCTQDSSKEVSSHEKSSFWTTHFRPLFFWKSIVKKTVSCIDNGDVICGQTSSNTCARSSHQNNVSSVKDNGNASQRVAAIPIKTKPCKRASLHNFKQKASNNPENKTFRFKVDSTPETTGKTKEPGSAPTLSFGEMNDEEWFCFIDWFRELLPEALAAKRNEQAGCRQRLGVSCRF